MSDDKYTAIVLAELTADGFMPYPAGGDIHKEYRPGDGPFSYTVHYRADDNVFYVTAGGYSLKGEFGNLVDARLKGHANIYKKLKKLFKKCGDELNVLHGQIMDTDS